MKTKDFTENTVLHYAVTCGLEDASDMCEILLRNGVDIDAKDSDGQNTALHLAVKDANECSEEIIQIILDYGANTELKNEYTMTPFEYATVKGNSKAVRVFVENGLCSLQTRQIERYNVNYSALEIALEIYKQHNLKKSHNVIKTMLYAMSKN